MFIGKLQPITDVFDWLHSAWERAATQRRVALCILWVYLLALLGVELKRLGYCRRGWQILRHTAIFMPSIWPLL